MDMTLEDWLEWDEYERMETGFGPVAVSRYHEPDNKLPLRLFGTEYEAGQLWLRLESEAPEWEPELGPGFTNYGLYIVTHPGRGVLNVAVLHHGPNVDPREYMEEEHEVLQMTTDVLREEVMERADGEPHPVWGHRELPFGPAVVLLGSCRDVDPASVGIDPAIVVDTGWDRLPEALGRVMDHHRPEGERLLAREFRSALMGLGCNWIDPVDCLGVLDCAQAQLFGQPLEEVA